MLVSDWLELKFKKNSNRSQNSSTSVVFLCLQFCIVVLAATSKQVGEGWSTITKSKKRIEEFYTKTQFLNRLC